MNLDNIKLLKSKLKLKEKLNFIHLLFLLIIGFIVVMTTYSLTFEKDNKKDDIQIEYNIFSQYGIRIGPIFDLERKIFDLEQECKTHIKLNSNIMNDSHNIMKVLSEKYNEKKAEIIVLPMDILNKEKSLVIFEKTTWEPLSVSINRGRSKALILGEVKLSDIEPLNSFSFAKEIAKFVKNNPEYSFFLVKDELKLVTNSTDETMFHIVVFVNTETINKIDKEC